MKVILKDTFSNAKSFSAYADSGADDNDYQIFNRNHMDRKPGKQKSLEGSGYL